jgi:AcrR family transcriptional regulator
MDLRERILRAAAAVFAEEGFRGATTRRIAQEAGVNEITLFRHFGSKERLLMEACVVADVEVEEPPLPADPVRPRAELKGWARQHMALLLEKRSFIRTCMAEVEEHPEMMPPDNRTVRTMLNLRAYLQRLKDRRLTSAPFDPAIAAPMLMGVLFADAMGRDVMPGLFANEPEEAIDQYVDLFLRGIGLKAVQPKTRERAS